jgi:YbbR domain-containing protein
VIKTLPGLSGIQVQNSVVPYTLNIDTLATINLPVQVRVQRVVAGWFVTKQEAQCPEAPCSVTFTGPKSWETNLAAYADVTEPIQADRRDFLTQSVLLVQKGQPLDRTINTDPQVTVDPDTVTIHIEARTGTTQRKVVLLDSQPSHSPPPGYRVTNVTVNPVTVVISGAPELLARITTISLPPVDLSGKTSTATFRISIPYPEGVTGPAGVVATVTYTIAANPNVSPSPQA